MMAIAYALYNISIAKKHMTRRDMCGCLKMSLCHHAALFG